MRLIILYLSALLGALHVVLCNQFISLIAPPAIFSNKPYRAFLTTSTFTDNIDIVVKFRKEEGFFRIKQGQETKHDKIVIFDKAGEKSFKDNKAQKYKGQLGYPLKILARQNDQCISKDIIIVNTPREDHTFIQLDKPFYKPGDEIKIRVIVFDHDTKPVGINSVKIELVDSEGNLVDRLNDLSEQHYRSEGFFESTIQLANEVNLGNWEISAQINDNNRTIAKKIFKVDKIKLPFFEVVINCKKLVYLVDRFIEFEIFGKYAFDEYAKGKVAMNITNNATGALMYEDNFDIESIKTIKIHIKDDLRINGIPKGELNLTINVDLIDTSMSTIQSKSETIKLLTKRKHTIEIKKIYPFQDGFDYDFDVMVRDHNKKIISSSASPVQMKYEMRFRSGSPVNKGIHTNIKKSVASFKIDGIKGVQELKVTIKYLDAEIEEIIKPDIALTEALRVSVDHNHISEDFNADLALKVEYSQGLGEVVVLVVTRMGIVYSQHSDCEGEHSCHFYLNKISSIYEEMKPEAKIVVYSVEHYNKQVLYGSTLLKLDGFGSNKLELRLSSKRAQPKDEFGFEFYSKDGAIVSLLAIDKKLTFVAKGHDVTKEDVINALTNTKKLFHGENAKSKDVTFDRANHNFIVNLQLDKWRKCTRDELTILEKINNPNIKPRSNGGGLFYDGDEQDPLDIEIVENPEETEEFDVRKKFPETWIWETVKLDGDESGRIQEKVPDSITSWIFTGLSIHKDFGFAIANPQELVVSQEFFIELNLPYSIKFGEIFKLEVIAFNFVSARYAGNLKVDIKVLAQHEDGSDQQFEFMKFTNPGFTCQTEAINEKIQTATFQVPHRTGSRKKFLIRPLVNKKIKIRIEAEATNTNSGKKITWFDKIEKYLIVENEGVAYYDTNNFEFSLKGEKKLHTHEFVANDVMEGSIESSAVIVGDMMGVSLNFYSGLFIQPSGCGEQTMAGYGRTLWLYKYLKSTDKLSAANEKTAKELLKKGYQHMMKYKKADGGFGVFFDTQTSAKGSTWMAAYVARLIGSAMQFGIEPINPDIVKCALKYCVENQNSDGSFKEVDYSKQPSNPEESPVSRPIRFTAFVLLALLTNRDYVQNTYADVIEKAFAYIENRFNYDSYGAAVAAYASALANRATLENYFDTLESQSEADGETRYWNIEKGKKTTLDTQVLISAYTAMAYIEAKKIEKAQPIIRWLMRNKNPQGGFSDSHSTAVGMEALAKMASVTGAGDTDIHFELANEDANQKKEYDLTNEKALKPHFIEMPKGTEKIVVSGVGKGYGVVTTYFEYYKIVAEISRTFTLYVNSQILPGNAAKVEACISRKLERISSDMVIMEFSLTSGYVYEAARSNPMSQRKNIRNVETRRGGTMVDLYFDEIPFGESQCVYIIVKQAFKVIEEKKASVKVYEYNMRDSTFASAFYKIGDPGCV